MKIMVIGLGSMGKRRIRLISQNYKEVSIIGVDSRKDRRDEVSKLFNISVYDKLEESVKKEKPEVAFICTAPISHPELTLQCINLGLHIFSEINLVNKNHEELIKIANKKSCYLFLSSTPMYRKEIQYITDMIEKVSKPVNYIYHVGQYLPDWHPWENYKDFFVGDKQTNGCREIFCIELPWMIKAFGEIKGLQTVKSKISTLNIDYNDNFIVTIIHENGSKGVFCVDVVSRKAMRSLEIYNENLHIKWDGTPNTLSTYNFENQALETINTYDKVEHHEDYGESIIENMYLDEIKNFFECIKERANPLHSFEQDAKVLKLIDEIEGE